jgi:L-aspartate oxidase
MHESRRPFLLGTFFCVGPSANEKLRTDLWGRSTLRGLYAAGEVTCTGVHGANRLASNSLLEGLVFGARAGEAATDDSKELSVERREASANADSLSTLNSPLSTAVKKRVKRIMWERVGILRDRDSLIRALKEFNQIATGNLSTSSRNFVTLAKLVATAALWREESRGGHFRDDFPETRDEWRVHSIQRRDGEISSVAQINFDTARAV